MGGLELRHVPAVAPAITWASLPCAARGRRPQDDRRDRARPCPQGSRLLRPGYCADIAIFDPADFRDQATYADAHRLSGARTTVIVNGTIVVDDAVHTGALPGKVLQTSAWRTVVLIVRNG